MRLPKLILAGGLLVVVALYSMAWSGTLHFDDKANLNGLHGNSYFVTGLQFVFSGASGPTGPPFFVIFQVMDHAESNLEHRSQLPGALVHGQ